MIGETETSTPQTGSVLQVVSAVRAAAVEQGGQVNRVRRALGEGPRGVDDGGRGGKEGGARRRGDVVARVVAICQGACFNQVWWSRRWWSGASASASARVEEGLSRSSDRKSGKRKGGRGRESQEGASD